LSREFAKGLTVRAVVFGVVLTIMAILWLDLGEWWACQNFVGPTGLTGHWPWQPLNQLDLGSMGEFADFSYVPLLFFIFIPVLVAALLPARYRLSPSELAFISSMVAPTITIALNNCGVGKWTRMVRQGLSLAQAIRTQIRSFAPDVFSPKNARVLQAMLTGEATIDWSLWATPVAFWIVFALSMYYFQLFGASLLRKQYVEIEVLPFPLATCTNETISLSTAESRPKLFRAELLWLGALIAFAATLYQCLNNIYPPAPSPKYYVDMLPRTLIPSGLLCYFFMPYLFGFGFILPIDVTLTQVAAYVVMFGVLPSVFISAGQLAPLTAATAASGDFVHSRTWLQFEFSPATWFKQGYMPFATGLLLMIGIWPLIAHRTQVLNTLRAALGRAGISEEGEPMSYRLQWLGCVISGVVLLLVNVWAEVPIYYAVVLVAFAGLTWMSIGRIQAECGNGLGNWMRDVGSAYDFNVEMISRGIGATSTPEVCYPTVTMGWLMGGSSRSLMFTNQFGWSLDSYRVGFENKARSRDIFIAQIAGVTLSAVIAVPLCLWLAYTYGLRGRNVSGLGSPQGFQDARNLLRGRLRGTAAMQPNAGTAVTLMLGIAVVVVINVLRSTYAGPFTLISPAGIWLAMQTGQRLWFPFLVATIVKWIALRVGGTKFYQEKILPLGVGFILGTALVWPITAVALILRGLGYQWW